MEAAFCVDASAQYKSFYHRQLGDRIILQPKIQYPRMALVERLSEEELSEEQLSDRKTAFVMILGESAIASSMDAKERFQILGIS
ncbi:MAG: hypothetical protein F6K16_29810 [Symploca sp. SIO2B6]|nr:hypothetical protein [Symploca sp. SIO2B6]